MANFSPASERNPLKIKLSITWRGIQPGLKILARFDQTGLGFSSLAEKISCNRNGISARVEKQETIYIYIFFFFFFFFLSFLLLYYIL